MNRNTVLLIIVLSIMIIQIPLQVNAEPSEIRTNVRAGNMKFIKTESFNTTYNIKVKSSYKISIFIIHGYEYPIYYNNNTKFPDKYIIIDSIKTEFNITFIKYETLYIVFDNRNGTKDAFLTITITIINETNYESGNYKELPSYEIATVITVSAATAAVVASLKKYDII